MKMMMIGVFRKKLNLLNLKFNNNKNKEEVKRKEDEEERKRIRIHKIKRFSKNSKKLKKIQMIWKYFNKC